MGHNARAQAENQDLSKIGSTCQSERIGGYVSLLVEYTGETVLRFNWEMDWSIEVFGGVINILLGLFHLFHCREFCLHYSPANHQVEWGWEEWIHYYQETSNKLVVFTTFALVPGCAGIIVWSFLAKSMTVLHFYILYRPWPYKRLSDPSAKYKILDIFYLISDL